MTLLPWIWSFIIVIAIIIELLTTDIDAIWFAFSSVVALILSLFDVSIVWQIVAFFTISVTLIFTVGRWTKKFLSLRNIATNSDSLIGKEISILEEASEYQKGSGIISGVVWTVLCIKGEQVEKGSRAVIMAIDGNKLIVKNIEKGE